MTIVKIKEQNVSQISVNMMDAIRRDNVSTGECVHLTGVEPVSVSLYTRFNILSD